MAGRTAGRAGDALKRALAAVVAAVGALAWAVPAYRDGPPTGHTGGFGEPLCSECHFGAPVNAEPGELRVEAPARFRPGQAYELRVRLRHPELAAAGFQLAVRFAEGARAGEQAGILTRIDSRAMVTTDTVTGVQYAHQTAGGAAPTAASETRWAIRWTAPDTAADVLLHAAANAANDDASEFGDFIYASTHPIRPTP